MSNSLQTGQFYGATQRTLDTAGIVLTELRHKTGRKLPRHTHESAYFSLLLDGTYKEQCTSRSAEYGAFTVGFHPPSLTHRDEIGSSGARMLCIELRDDFLERMRKYFTDPQFTPDLCGAETTWLSLKLYRQFKNQTASRLVVEELCADMLERAACIPVGKETSMPVWLRRAEELLRASFSEALTLEGVAAAVAVHPIHLSRVFRRKWGCTLGEFVHRLRIQFACRRLANDDISLGDLAAVLGFADQSHFGRVFKLHTGQSPAAFRAWIAPHLRPAFSD